MVAAKRPHGAYDLLGGGIARAITDEEYAEPRVTAEQVNGRPEPIPYRYQGQSEWTPADADIRRDRTAEQAGWAAANAELVARIRARLPKGLPPDVCGSSITQP